MQDFVKELAKKHKMDPRVVKHIVDHPARFIRKVIVSSDVRPVRLMHFGIFDLKHPTLKLRKAQIKVDIIKSVLSELSTTVDMPEDVIINEAEHLLLQGKYNELSMLYKKYVVVIRKILKSRKLLANKEV